MIATRNAIDGSVSNSCHPSPRKNSSSPFTKPRFQSLTVLAVVISDARTEDSWVDPRRLDPMMSPVSTAKYRNRSVVAISPRASRPDHYSRRYSRHCDDSGHNIMSKPGPTYHFDRRATRHRCERSRSHNNAPDGSSDRGGGLSWSACLDGRGGTGAARVL